MPYVRFGTACDLRETGESYRDCPRGIVPVMPSPMSAKLKGMISLLSVCIALLIARIMAGGARPNRSAACRVRSLLQAKLWATTDAGAPALPADRGVFTKEAHETLRRPGTDPIFRGTSGAAHHRTSMS
jgi:hypothetical protein